MAGSSKILFGPGASASDAFVPPETVATGLLGVRRDPVVAALIFMLATVEATVMLTTDHPPRLPFPG